MNIDDWYADLISNILETGKEIKTRNSICKRIFVEKVVIGSTPLISLRKTAWKNALREWEWFMSGSNNINDLHPSVQAWWKPWANSLGYIYYNYSEQFRRYGDEEFDQLAYFINGIRGHPYSRRNVMTTWHSHEMASKSCPITNCHGTVIQAFVEDNKLHLVTYQRSVDVICGLPHNLIQYWAFLKWLAYITTYDIGTLVWIGGDIHIYQEHYELADKIRLQRRYTGLGSEEYVPPRLAYTPKIEDEIFRADDFTLSGDYRPILEDKAVMVV